MVHFEIEKCGVEVTGNVVYGGCFVYGGSLLISSSTNIIVSLMFKPTIIRTFVLKKILCDFL